MAFKFEKLEVWQKAIEFIGKTHELTRKFPKEELYILTNQIKRAADSIALNIAKGSTGQTNAEFRHFFSKFYCDIGHKIYFFLINTLQEIFKHFCPYYIKYFFSNFFYVSFVKLCIRRIYC